MLRLLEDKIAVIPLDDPDRRPSGLWIPPGSKQRIDQGIIKYRAPGCKELKIGDHVYFSGYDGTKVSIEGEGVLIILREAYIKAVDEGEGMALFPLQEVKRIIDLCYGEYQSREIAPGLGTMPSKEVRYFKEILTARFNDWFASEGIEF